MVDIDALKRTFHELYGRTPRLFVAPGRVNLIGEHTDYNEGFVLPMAVDRKTIVAVGPREDRRVRVHSLDLQEVAAFDLDHEDRANATHWAAYIEGVARVLEKRGFKLTGAELAISSDVPMGGGLGSSAALEISTGYALLTLSGHEIDLKQLALAGQTAEHLYVGTRCGIMDQLAAALGKKSHALLIDCRSLETVPVDLNLPGIAVVVCNTNVEHELASSAYNERRRECERAVEILRQVLPGIQALRDMSWEQFEKYAELLPEPERSRCRHVISENERTLEAAEALKTGKLERLGELMALSHKSLSEDYEVSCRELDVMVDLARKHNGVVGARMTGGGFGGCTVNLVAGEELNNFREFVTSGYEAATGIVPTIYVVAASDGVREMLPE